MNKIQVLAALGMVLFFIILSTASMMNLSLTADEGMHYAYGTSILNLNSDRLVDKSGLVDDSKMPISALNALPAKLAAAMPAGRFGNILSSFSVARLITILFSAFVAFMVFYWSKSLYGFAAALVSLGLFILDPNIIAHSQLVTTDLYSAGAVLVSSWSLWRFAKHRSIINGLILAFALALSQLTKYTALALYPLSVVALLLCDAPELVRICKDRRIRAVGNYFVKFLMYLLVAALIFILVLNIGYLFNRTFTRLGNYEFGSNFFKSFQTVSMIASIPVSIPYPYLQGLDLMLVTDHTGVRYGGVYLMGQLHPDGQGFAGYYFVASFFKMPIATQIILIAATLVYLFDKKRRANFLSNEVFLLVPVIFYTIYFNFMLNAQVGFRYYIVALPLLYIFAGHLFQNWMAFGRVQRAAFWVLAGYLLVSMFSYYPHYISYFNEFVLNRTMAYKYLADSNLDWGQSKNYLRDYMKGHRGAIFEPDKIMAGRIIVSVNDLVGLYNPSRFAWLRDNFEPVGNVAYSYLIYDVSQQDLDRLCVTKGICQ